VTGSSVTLDSGTGVGNASNAVLTVAGTLAARSRTSGGVFVSQAGAVTLNTIGTVSNTTAGGGAYDVTAGGMITVAGAVNTAGTVLISATSGDLDITTGSVTSSAIGDAVTLATAGNFSNDVGASAVQAANGRWLIYSANPAGDTFAGLDSANTAIWGTAAGATVSASGNRYVFALAPTLTVTSTNDSKVYGTDDGVAIAADYSVTGVQSGVAGAYLGDTIATAYSGAATVSSAGSAANAHVVAGGYAYTLGLGTLTSASGYSFTLANTGKLTVTPAALTITADNQSKVYGAVLPTLTASYAGLVNGDTAASLTTGPTLTTTATAASHVAGGPYAITASGAASSDYTISYVAGALTVTQAALTITADNQSKVYGAVLPTLTASYAGFVNNDTLASLTTGPTLTTTATAASHVAGSPYAITASGAVDSDYKISYAGGNLTVTAAPLTIAADNQSKVYGAVLPTLTASYAGLVNGDTAASLTTGPTLTTTATAASHVAGGPYAITASGAASSDYTISYVAGQLTVTQAALTITADNQSKVYGAALPTLTASYAGFVNNDTLASLTTGPTLTTTATAASHVSGSPYAITASGAVNSDYKISYVAGSLAVTPAALTITADSKTMTYGDGLPALTATYSGFVNGDGSGSLTTAPILASATPATANAGTYKGTLTASGAVDSDYVISYAAGSLTIGQRAITVTADAQSRVKNDPNPPLTFQVGGRGLVNGDTLNGGLATSATTQSDAGIYGITEGTLAASRNYALSYIGANLTVTPLPVSPSAVVNPVTVAGSQFQPPVNASISLVTPPVATGGDNRGWDRGRRSRHRHARVARL
jgi:hypothetical protein